MRRLSLGACLMIAACDAPPAPRAAPNPEVAPPVAPVAVAPPAVAPPAVAPPAVAPVAVESPPVTPPPETPLAGSGPSGAEGRAARRQAVLDLLTDGRSAAGLDLIAASPGRAFDPYLADEMTPKVYISRSTVPEIRQLKLTIDGPLDKDIIRRIIRAHINELRYCYMKGLARDPNLKGRLELEFEILDTGKVGTAAFRPTKLADPQVATCSANAVRRWTFPKPDKLVKVLAPFELSAP